MVRQFIIIQLKQLIYTSMFQVPGIKDRTSFISLTLTVSPDQKKSAITKHRVPPAKVPLERQGNVVTTLNNQPETSETTGMKRQNLFQSRFFF